MARPLRVSAIRALQEWLRASGVTTVVVDGKEKNFTVDGGYGPMTDIAAKQNPSIVVDAMQQLIRDLTPAPAEKQSPSAFVSDPPFAEVLEAVTAEARKRGLDPTPYLAQVTLESGWGRNVPRLADGRSSLNYAGLKFESVKQRVTERANARTTEYDKGIALSVVDSFAVFNTLADFAEVYFWYLFEGPSSYRYPGLDQADVNSFGSILRKGGYATDPQYAQAIIGVAASVSRRYPHLTA